MRFEEQYKELSIRHADAYHAWVYAQQELEELVGARMRAVQEIVISVLIKLNGCDPRAERFNSGGQPWAWQLRNGFKVVRLEPTHVVVEALVTAGDLASPVRYSLPRSWLTCSDRSLAAKVRRDYWKMEERNRTVRKNQAPRKLRELAREEKKLQRQAEELAARRAALEAAAAYKK